MNGGYGRELANAVASEWPQYSERRLTGCKTSIGSNGSSTVCHVGQ
jgi:hypothetical protein